MGGKSDKVREKRRVRGSGIKALGPGRFKIWFGVLNAKTGKVTSFAKIIDGVTVDEAIKIKQESHSALMVSTRENRLERYSNLERLYVSCVGKLGTRDIARLSGVSPRTVARLSKDGRWTEKVRVRRSAVSLLQRAEELARDSAEYLSSKMPHQDKESALVLNRYADQLSSYIRRHIPGDEQLRALIVADNEAETRRQLLLLADITPTSSKSVSQPQPKPEEEPLDCPSCGTQIPVPPSASLVHCPGCAKLFIVEEDGAWFTRNNDRAVEGLEIPSDNDSLIIEILWCRVAFPSVNKAAERGLKLEPGIRRLLRLTVGNEVVSCLSELTTITNSVDAFGSFIAIFPETGLRQRFIDRWVSGGSVSGKEVVPYYLACAKALLSTKQGVLDERANETEVDRGAVVGPGGVGGQSRDQDDGQH